jgi:hypothetical protein
MKIRTTLLSHRLLTAVVLKGYLLSILFFIEVKRAKILNKKMMERLKGKGKMNSLKDRF